MAAGASRKDLLDLARRCRTEGPGYALEVEIRRLLADGAREDRPPPPYTVSLDACRELHRHLLPGWDATLRVGSEAGRGRHGTTMRHPEPPYRDTGYVEADTPALAYVAAVLVALAAEAPGAAG